MIPADATRPSLLIAIRDAGNQTAWNEFVALYTPLVYGHCVRRGLQVADAADVAQEVLKAVAGAIGRFEYDRRKGSFRAWLLTVTRRKLANFFTACSINSGWYICVCVDRMPCAGRRTARPPHPLQPPPLESIQLNIAKHTQLQRICCLKRVFAQPRSCL